MRRLSIDGALYLWRVTHEHEVGQQGRPLAGTCREIFTAYLAGRKASPLRVVFAGGTLQPGYPEAGVVWIPGPRTPHGVPSPPSAELNLNLPSTAVKLIAYARNAGWTPELGKQSHVLEDGLAILTALCAD